jgi:X-X-X-Leu-X-X-Gly heptad repeat protein
MAYEAMFPTLPQVNANAGQVNSNAGQVNANIQQVNANVGQQVLVAPAAPQ